MLIKGDCYQWNANAYMALKAARFSSKKDSSIQKNLEFKNDTRKGKKNMFWMDLIWEYQQNKCPLYLIRFARTDELWNLADADFARPPSSRTARSSSLIVTFSRSTWLISEWLQPLKCFQLLNNTEWLPIHFFKKRIHGGKSINPRPRPVGPSSGSRTSIHLSLCGSGRAHHKGARSGPEDFNFFWMRLRSCPLARMWFFIIRSGWPMVWEML